MSAQRIEQLAEGVTLWPGGCRTVLPHVDANSIDAGVTDPPYGLGFMGKGWDHGVPDVDHWRAIFRVLKPGAHLAAFGGTRTFGRLWIVIEEAGFEIRDTIMWVYGSGFPKSLDVSKAIDKAAGAKRTKVEATGALHKNRLMNDDGWSKIGADIALMDSDDPATAAARQWSGFGTALKPAVEPIILARKPLEGTVAANVLKWGTGALNIDGCRVASGGDDLNGGTYSGSRRVRNVYTSTDTDPNAAPLNRLANGAGEFVPPDGRWPANLIHDGSEEVIAAFPQSKSEGGSAPNQQPAPITENGGFREETNRPYFHYGDSGSAARFFYTAKADADDRLGSKHPTVKPLDLMQYLVRLVTPKGGTVLDPFAGTGTTGEAAFREGMKAVLIEREEEYQNDIRRRMRLAMSGPDERKREGVKARHADKPADHGPLFGGTDSTRGQRPADLRTLRRP